jgi:pyruvate formate lyase activating enzyme
MSALIYDIKRFTVHDGPGIRTTVFFKGCPLNCLWCHNPESRNPEPEKLFKENRIGEKQFVTEEIIGKEYSVEQLISEIEKDQIFFEESNGGVTFSGGEPLLQFDFLFEVLKVLKEKGIHTAVDTCGFTASDSLKRILHLPDIFLFDLKVINTEKHIVYNGVSNEVILENLKILSESKCKIYVRFPVIPGFNDDQTNVNDMIALLKTINFEELNLLRYHNLAKTKCQRLGKKYEMPDIPNTKKEDLLELKRSFETAGFKVKIV